MKKKKYSRKAKRFGKNIFLAFIVGLAFLFIQFIVNGLNTFFPNLTATAQVIIGVIGLGVMATLGYYVFSRRTK